MAPKRPLDPNIDPVLQDIEGTPSQSKRPCRDSPLPPASNTVVECGGFLFPTNMSFTFPSSPSQEPSIHASLLESSPLSIDAIHVPTTIHAVTLPPNDTHIKSIGSTTDYLKRLRDETFENRSKRQLEMDEAKGTGRSYERHQISFAEWWDHYNDELQAQDSSFSRIPLHPINATKVAAFLEYEMTRPKVC